MLLSITSTHRPATDLSYLLHKNPVRVHETELSFGSALVFYPEVSEARTTAALVLDVDPVALVRGKGQGEGLLDQYVNDRPYVASSFLSVAIAKALRNALNGSSKERPDLAATAIPLRAHVLPLPVRGSRDLVTALFQPLGYDVGVEDIPLDETLGYLGPEWAHSPYVSLTLSGTVRLSELLSHLYVLIPVLDSKKHYFVDRQEIEKLIDKGGSWLAAHPARELIATRYLRQQRTWAREALTRLAEDDAIDDVLEETARIEAAGEAAPTPATRPKPESTDDADAAAFPAPRKDAAEEALEQPIRLHDLRLDTVAAIVADSGARRVVDLGCGSGKLLARLMKVKHLSAIVGVDVSMASLAMAARRLRLDRLPPRQRERITLLQGALTYRDRRIEDHDAIALVEVIEHLEIDRLRAMERAVFEHAHPALVVVTTPNVEYNVRFPGLAPGTLRHADHRFEWTRHEFLTWAESVADRHGYRVELSGLGEADVDVGSPSQMAVFRLIGVT
ncbi:MAG: 3' terminal RNA ribose 2'-O-methyltransferase Hen1 [Hyphomicrobiaceae bacterium]|nr:3' terminal RNA ribose 2'-O-methyltransferase Hen1 [Hyphomicrobiaceae bacterium]